MAEAVSKVRVERLALLDEAVLALLERRTRSALTCLGTVLGVGVLVSVLGLTSSATSQIDGRFTALAATEVTITQVPSGATTRTLTFPRDFEDRVERIDGVQNAGLVWPIPPETARVSTSTLPGVDNGDSTPIEVLAVTPGALQVAKASVSVGVTFNDFMQSNSARVVMLGPTVASRLGISNLTARPSLLIGGESFTVVGILASVERHAELLNAAMVPTSTAKSMWGEPRGGQPPSGWVEVDRGAGRVVADQLAIATSATSPERFEVVPPPDPRVLRGSINEDLRSLFLVLAGVCLLVGMVGIANTMFVTVMERLGEIGLRRSLGARKWHIASQFLAEATVIGLVGGMLGSLIGLAVVVAVSMANSWTAVLSPALVVAGPFIGAAASFAAALYPALRGAATEPVQALRTGT